MILPRHTLHTRDMYSAVHWIWYEGSRLESASGNLNGMETSRSHHAKWAFIDPVVLFT